MPPRPATSSMRYPATCSGRPVVGSSSKPAEDTPPASLVCTGGGTAELDLRFRTIDQGSRQLDSVPRGDGNRAVVLVRCQRLQPQSNGLGFLSSDVREQGR